MILKPYLEVLDIPPFHTDAEFSDACDLIQIADMVIEAYADISLRMVWESPRLISEIDESFQCLLRYNLIVTIVVKDEEFYALTDKGYKVYQLIKKYKRLNSINRDKND